MMAQNRKGNNTMALAENLQYLRAIHNLTQEQFADELSVSRQTVSKWESGACQPEMDKLMEICTRWHTDMDTLLRGSVEAASQADAVHYDAHMNAFSKWMAAGTGLVLLGVSLMMAISSLKKGNSGTMEILGTMAMLAFVVVAVVIFIVVGTQHDHFCEKNPMMPEIYTPQQKEAFAAKWPWMVAIPVAGILLDVIFVVGFGNLVDGNEPLELRLMSVFILIIAICTMALVYAGVQEDKYNIKRYNSENNPDPAAKERRDFIGRICGVIMMIAVAIYLLTGFAWNMWSKTWFVFAIGGVCCAIASIALNKEQ
jgi:transcriptional regulator with XRE-family HTH domain